MAEDGVDIKEVYELAGYIDVVSSKTVSLHKTVSLLESDNAVLGARVGQLLHQLSFEVDSLKSDVSDLKRDVAELQKAMLAMVSRLKSTLKNDDFERFEKRVDAWSPEALVSRREANRIVKLL